MPGRSTSRSAVRSLPGSISVPVLAAVLLVSLLVAPQPAGASIPSFTFNGSGWGHGIGLSQYGAKGFAEAGRSGEWIAGYYFPGTNIGSVSQKTVQVNLHPDANYRSTSSTYNNGFVSSSWRLRPGWAGGVLVVNGVSHADATYTFAASGTSILLRNAAGATLATFTGAVDVGATGSGSPALIQVVDGSGAFGHGYVRYRGGMRISASGGKLKLLNRLGMEDYLRGVVPRESPSSWHLEALKAQAIVARSYAHVSGSELYCTTWSQVYNGHSKGSDRTATELHETTRTNQAIDATTNKVVMYGGKAIQTFFHSSSGGHTANIEDVWLGTGEPSTTHPYRRGVPDPHVISAGCPNTPWKDPITIDGLALAGRLRSYSAAKAPNGAGTSIWVSGLAYDAGASGHVRTVDIIWSNGVRSTGFPGDTLRSALGLRSTRIGPWFPTERVALGDRYSTSVAISQRLYPSGPAQAAVVASGEDEKFADALTSSGLAGIVGGPVLLVQKDAVSPLVLAELNRLKVGRVYIVGGVQSVSPSVEQTIRSRGYVVERLAGSARYGYDRYGTAASVAMKMKQLGGFDGSVLVASGEVWADAALAASISSGSSRPIVLVRRTTVPTGTRAALSDLGATQTILFGGPNTVSMEAVSGLSPAPTRRFGMTGDRYTLAAEVGTWAVTSEGYSMKAPYIATGERFPDSVTGGVLAGATKNPLLLTLRDTAPSGTLQMLARYKSDVEVLVLLGGPASVGQGAVSSMAGALK